jgi:hypothetical protein
MTLDSWNSLFQTLSVVLLALTLAVGAGAVITSQKMARRERTRVAEAERATAEANKQAAEAAQETARALADAAAARERAAALERDAAEQRARAAAAERALLQFQGRLAWRRLTPEQTSRLVAGLRDFAGSSIVITALSDPEAGPLAEQIVNVLNMAGWRTTLNRTGLMMPPVYGIRCTYSRGHADAEAFVRLLQQEDFVVEQRVRDDEGELTVVVGLKPPA